MNKKPPVVYGAKLGRYPFFALIPFYVRTKGPYLADTSLQEDTRKLRYIGRILQQLRDAGQVRTTDPRNLDEDDIAGFLQWMKKKQLQAATRIKYIQVLDRFMRTCGNYCLRDLRQDRDVRLPRDLGDKPIAALSVEQLQQILDATYTIEGWRGQVLRGIVALGFGTGCRPKELFNAQVEDLDLAGARFYVRHPKGEGSWGANQWVPIIRGDMIPYLDELLQARKSLENVPAALPYLFLDLRAGRAYSGNGLRHIKSEVEIITGIKWAYKDLRSTLTTVTIAGDVSRIKAVSLQLRHSSVKTTEHYYARINRTAEIRNSIGDVWEKSPIKPPKQ